MKLSPMSATPEPTYPTYNRTSTAWRRIAAAVAVSATLWLPACGDESCPTSPTGVDGLIETRLAGEAQVVEPPQPVSDVKPPEPDPIRLSGDVAPVAPPPPPVEPPPIRFAGRARSPEPPKSLAD
jgi:hypothetical protein